MTNQNLRVSENMILGMEINSLANSDVVTDTDSPTGPQHRKAANIRIITKLKVAGTWPISCPAAMKPDIAVDTAIRRDLYTSL